jgi:hypothetical protein
MVTAVKIDPPKRKKRDELKLPHSSTSGDRRPALPVAAPQHYRLDCFDQITYVFYTVALPGFGGRHYR